MAEIFEFPKEENRSNDGCEVCQIVDEYLEIAMEAQSSEELKATLRGLFDDAHLIGYKDAFHHDIHMKMDFLDNIDNDLE